MTSLDADSKNHVYHAIYKVDHQCSSRKYKRMKNNPSMLVIASLMLIAPAIAEEVVVPEPNPYFYEDTSIMQLKVRGKYGRYITFVGKTKNKVSGTAGSYSAGSPGTVNCSDFGGYTSCTTTGYVAPSYTPGRPGGVQNRRYIYELDCVDRTFNRQGDRASAGGGLKGWMRVDEDPVANAVAKKYCDKISLLPKKEEHSWKRSIEESTNEWELIFASFTQSCKNYIEDCKFAWVKDRKSVGEEKYSFLLRIKSFNNKEIKSSFLADCKEKKYKPWSRHSKWGTPTSELTKHALSKICAGEVDDKVIRLRNSIQGLDKDRSFEILRESI